MSLSKFTNLFVLWGAILFPGLTQTTPEGNRGVSDEKTQNLDGYAGIGWGSSVAQVKAKYGKLKTGKGQNAKSEIVTLSQDNPTKEILSRSFAFVHGKLYNVIVIYSKKFLKEDFSALLFEFENKYGSDYRSDEKVSGFLKAEIKIWSFGDTEIRLSTLEGGGGFIITASYLSIELETEVPNSSE